MTVPMRVIAGACGMLLTVAGACAQPSRGEPGAARFDVAGYGVYGRMLLKTEDFTRVVAPFVGRGKTATDIERARSELQQTYHDLGHCSVKVTLASPEPRDGVVTFRLVDMPASEVRDCLPVVTLDPQPRPRAAVPGAGSEGAATYAYVDLREPSKAVAAAPAAKGPVEPAPVARRSPAPVASPQPPPTTPPSVVAQASPAKPAPTAPAKPAIAAPAAGTGIPGAPTFDIRRFAVEGNTLLKQDQIDRALAPYTGTGKDFGDVQRALEALQLAYQQQGYGAVDIRLPEQELEKGEVRFRVVEPKIRRVLVEGNEHYSEANIRRSVPALRIGETPRSADVAANIRLANENPAKQSTVLLRAAEREDQVDATIRVADVDPVRLSVSFDNTGTEATHRYRTGFAFQHANVFDRDHVLTAQFITSPGNRHDVYVYGLGYRIPIYSLGDSIDLIGGYSNVDSGTVQDIFTVTGKGTIFAVRYNQALPKWGDLEQRITYGLDYRAYQNNVVPVGGIDTLVPDITLNPFSITYNGSMRGEQRELSFYLSISQNFPALNDGKDTDFKKLGARLDEGTAGYRLFRFGGSYSRELPGNWRFRIRLDGQYTDDALVAGEQFGIGGADSVRGFNERYRSDDKGYRTNWEIYTPDVAKQLGFENGRLRFLAFYDTGVVRRNREASNELEGASLDSAGLGLRMNYKTYFTARLDLAYVYHDGTQFQEPNGRRSSKKGHFSLAWVW